MMEWAYFAYYQDKHKDSAAYNAAWDRLNKALDSLAARDGIEDLALDATSCAMRDGFADGVRFMAQLMLEAAGSRA